MNNYVILLDDDGGEIVAKSVFTVVDRYLLKIKATITAHKYQGAIFKAVKVLTHFDGHKTMHNLENPVYFQSGDSMTIDLKLTLWVKEND